MFTFALTKDEIIYAEQGLHSLARRLFSGDTSVFDELDEIATRLQHLENEKSGTTITLDEARLLVFLHLCKYKTKTKPISSEYVYLVSGAGLFKIGMTENHVQGRIDSLQVGSPVTLTLVHVIETSDARDLENKLKKKFSKKRVHGEWFALDDDDVAYIKGLAS